MRVNPAEARTPRMGSSRLLAKLVGLTGGIGAGKSTVSKKLDELGALIVDSDEIARKVVSPGSDGLRLVIENFGNDMLASDGSLDRTKLASLVFADSAKVQMLNSLLHPLIEHEIKRLIACYRDDYEVIVVVIPLLFETNAKERYQIDKVIVVDLPEELAIERVSQSRGLSVNHIRSRMANQMSRSDRLALADYVVDNSASFADLELQVNRIWDDITSG